MTDHEAAKILAAVVRGLTEPKIIAHPLDPTVADLARAIVAETERRQYGTHTLKLAGS